MEDEWRFCRSYNRTSPTRVYINVFVTKYYYCFHSSFLVRLEHDLIHHDSHDIVRLRNRQCSRYSGARGPRFQSKRQSCHLSPNGSVSYFSSSTYLSPDTPHLNPRKRRSTPSYAASLDGYVAVIVTGGHSGGCSFLSFWTWG